MLANKSFLYISSAMGPVLTFSFIEATKPGHSALIGGLVVTIVCALGQLICIGAAYPIVYIPLYALSRALTLGEVHPRPAAGPKTQSFLAIVGTLVGGITIASVVTPMDTQAWAWANICFQLFPVIVLALPIYSLVAPRETTSVSQAAAYRSESPKTVLLYWVSLALFAMPVYNFFSGGAILINNSIVLIWWDMLGVFLTHVFIVIIDAVADGSNSVHKGHGWFVGTLRAFVSALVFGPGYTFNAYVANREQVAESARKVKSQ